MVGGQIRYRWQFANRVSGRKSVEYNHLSMGTSTINLTTATGALSRTEIVKHALDMATARVNNRWGGPVIVNYRSLANNGALTKGRPRARPFASSRLCCLLLPVLT